MLNPPNHSVVRLSLVIGRRACRTQRKVSHQAHNAKTTVTNVAQPLSLDPGAELVIQRRTMNSTLNPPDHSVTRPHLVAGRRIRFTRALIAINSGSLIMVSAYALQQTPISVIRNSILAASTRTRYQPRHFARLSFITRTLCWEQEFLGPDAGRPLSFSPQTDEYPLFNRLTHSLPALP